MKVIFLTDVPKIAKAGDIKEVADGYARNFLIPKKFALLADAQSLGVAEAQHRRKARGQGETEAEMRQLAGMLEGKEITLKGRAGAQERLFGSITTADITTELEKNGLV